MWPRLMKTTNTSFPLSSFLNLINKQIYVVEKWKNGVTTVQRLFTEWTEENHNSSESNIFQVVNY